jgi:hypothetical protein
MAVEVSSAQSFESRLHTCPIPPEAPATTKYHQHHLSFSFHSSANVPALIPIIATSATTEFCPTRSTFTPHC